MLGYNWLIMLQVLRVFSRQIREASGIGNQVPYDALVAPISRPWRQA